MTATFSSREVYTVLGIKPSTLRKWVQRGYVRKLARDRYVVEDIFSTARRIAADQHRALDACA